MHVWVDRFGYTTDQGQQDGEGLLTNMSRDLHGRETTRVSGYQRQL